MILSAAIILGDIAILIRLWPTSKPKGKHSIHVAQSKVYYPQGVDT